MPALTPVSVSSTSGSSFRGVEDTVDAESGDDCSGSGTGALPTKMCPSAYVHAAHESNVSVQ
ncbi:hypothetical protein ALMP_06680 [Streptomyces sp. A012304]|nr:hypothetical protein ALMP_06680 [Streptomyces sp. A012304]